MIIRTTIIGAELFILISNANIHINCFYCIYDFYTEISRSGHSCHAVTASKSHSEPQSYRKSHEKAPDKTENRMPGVKL